MEVHEIPEETLKRLIEEAKGTSEAKYILELEEWDEKSGVSTDYGTIDVVVGEVRKVLMAEEHREDGSDYRHYQKWAIIPLTIPVILIHHGEYDGWDEKREFMNVHVFTEEGWKKVFIKAK